MTVASLHKYESAAKGWRLCLEPKWPSWKERLERLFPGMLDRVGPPSKGMCDLSAFWLRNLIGGEVKTGFILPSDKTWAHHCWLEHGGFIIDLTADQFGMAPVIVTPKFKDLGERYSEQPFDEDWGYALAFNTEFLRLE